MENGDEVLVLAESLLSKVLEQPGQVIKRLSGQQLAGQRYVSPYDFFQVADKAHRIIAADFVTAEDGTGIVHIAPAFGADDLAAGRVNDLPCVPRRGQQRTFLCPSRIIFGWQVVQRRRC